MLGPFKKRTEDGDNNAEEYVLDIMIDEDTERTFIVEKGEKGWTYDRADTTFKINHSIGKKDDSPEEIGEKITKHQRKIRKEENDSDNIPF